MCLNYSFFFFRRLFGIALLWHTGAEWNLFFLCGESTYFTALKWGHQNIDIIGFRLKHYFESQAGASAFLHEEFVQVETCVLQLIISCKSCRNVLHTIKIQLSFFLYFLLVLSPPDSVQCDDSGEQHSPLFDTPVQSLIYQEVWFHGRWGESSYQQIFRFQVFFPHDFTASSCPLFPGWTEKRQSLSSPAAGISWSEKAALPLVNTSSVGWRATLCDIYCWWIHTGR